MGLEVMEGSQRVGRNGHLFARLDHRGGQWVLVVFMMVEFQFDLNEAAQAQGAPEWTEGEREAWADSFIRSAQDLYSYQWVLHSDFVEHVHDAMEVDVELVVVPVDTDRMVSGRDHVFTVFVIRGPKAKRPETFAHQSRPQIQLRECDINLLPSYGGGGILQRMSNHEIGHALGLEHPTCPGGELECYGDPKTESGQRISGLGSRVSLVDYRVFSEILKTLWPQQNWIATTAYLESDIPRRPPWMTRPVLNTRRPPSPTGVADSQVWPGHKLRLRRHR